MATKMLRISLSELTTARITCKVCNNGVIEVPIERLDTALDRGGACRFCNTPLLPSRDANSFNALRLAVQELGRVADKLGIDFDIAERL